MELELASKEGIYCSGHSVEKAKIAMKEVNPNLVNQIPQKALQALRTQFKAYLDGVEPFDHKL
jgi:hypothetical protein